MVFGSPNMAKEFPQVGRNLAERATAEGTAVGRAAVMRVILVKVVVERATRKKETTERAILKWEVDDFGKRAFTNRDGADHILTSQKSLSRTHIHFISITVLEMVIRYIVYNAIYLTINPKTPFHLDLNKLDLEPS